VYNSITFPAAILQPPFFDPNADPAVNFGAIGVAIGHEIGHGFDDQGSQSDGHGVLRNWWTQPSRDEFEARADRLVAQYDLYSPIEGVTVNGRLTLGENIGDLAGINVSYAAWKAFEQEHYDGEAPVLDGFTGDQRFFLAFAQLWRNIATDQAVQQLALTDPHSPGQFRANGIVRNFDPWYEAFDVTPDNDLYLAPNERVRIW
jgi:endothelin-converting enzyme/putative endopeptidase